ncbi:MAG: autotransporter domain-containing protein, partial [Sphingopyxis terrae]|nr:autotransporter domain-containing protein [Sphingopyxis terrae]
GGAGIITNNLGTGGVLVEATGTVTGALTGITIVALAGSGGDAEVISNNAAGGSSGIGVENRGGTGAIRITSTGTVQATGSEGFAILGLHSVQGAGGDLVIVANDISGAGGGINVSNAGGASTNITVNGTLNVASRQGISVGNGAAANDIVVTVRGSLTSGATGIAISNQGRGQTIVTAEQQIRSNNVRPQEAATSGNGMNITTGGSAGDIIAGVAGVEGRAGIVIRNLGQGALTLSASGLVEGREGRGVEIVGGPASGAIDVDLADATGSDGVVITAIGEAAGIDFTSNGTLTGTAGDGGFFQSAGAMRIDALGSSGARHGLAMIHGGPGEALLVSRGTATGGENGIAAETLGGSAGTMSLDVNDVSGGEFGVSILTREAGGATLITRGLINGGIAAINSVADNGGAFSLTNLGTIRNASSASADLAIQAAGGAVDILNNGSLLGTIRLDGGVVAPDPEPEEPQRELRVGARSAFIIAEVADVEASHRLTNAGTWNSIGGGSVFGGASDVLVNAAGGRLIGGVSAATAETTDYSGLETLINRGTITMVDGGVGDVVRTSGDADFIAGSVLAVDVGGGGADRFVADGATLIEAGATLQVTSPQALVIGTRYTILESAGGVTGNFALDNARTSAFLGFRQGSTPTTIFVELARLRAFAAAGLSPNQVAVGGALDGQAASDPLAAAALLLPTDAAARAAFDGLSGEIHPAVRTAMAEDLRLPRNAVLERLRSPQGGAVWGQFFGNWGENDGAGGTADLDRNTIGGLLGVDFGVGDTVVLGAAGAYLETDQTLAERASDAKLKSVHILGYAGGSFGNLSLKAGVGYASYDVSTRRFTAFPAIGQTLTGTYKGSVFHGFAEAGYRIGLGEGHVEPFGQLVAVRARTGNFAESGGSAALAGARTSENSLGSTLGARFETAPAGALSVAGMAGWQHGFGSLEPVTSLRFAAGPAFSIRAAGLSRNAGVAAVEARLRPSERILVSVGYDGVIGSAGQDHSIKAGVRISF